MTLRRVPTMSELNFNHNFNQTVYTLGENHFVFMLRQDDQTYIYIRKIINPHEEEGINYGVRLPVGVKLSPYQYCKLMDFIHDKLDEYEETVNSECETKYYHLGGTIKLDIIYNGENSDCSFQLNHTVNPESIGRKPEVIFSRDEFLNLKEKAFYFCKSCVQSDIDGTQ